MKSKKTELTRAALKKRLFIGFGALLVFYAAAAVFYFSVPGEVAEGGAPRTLRAGFLWNEKVWKSFFSRARLSPAEQPPPAGTEPRVNGDLGLQSEIPADYRIQVVSDDGRSAELGLAALRVLPQIDISTRFKCIEGWSIPIQYGGVRFSEFMKAYSLGKKADGSLYRYVGLATPDGEYYVSIDMDSMLHDQTLLTDRMNGAPLSEANGAPLRLVIPIKYGIKSLKRIGRIEFSDKRLPDYWAEQGYDWYSGL